MLLIELHHLPCLDYFSALMAADEIIVEQHESYQKQTYRNRCRILTANSVLTLTVPVEQANSKMLIRDVKIDDRQPWQRQHWGAIKLGYAKTPFFEHYEDFFRPFYQKKYTYLFDYNWELLTICLKLLGIKTTVVFTDYYSKMPDNEATDARDSIIFPKNEIYRNKYLPKSYQQNFGVEFVANLSVIDLLFCQGPQAFQFLGSRTSL